MTQLAYDLQPKIGKVGAIAESAEGIHARAKIASVAIPFGCLTVRDGDDKLAKLPTSSPEALSAAKSGGIAIATHAIVSDPNSSVPTYPAGKEFAQLRNGPVFVLVEENVTQGDQAFARFAAGGGGSQLGAFRKSADTATAVAIPGMYYKSSALAGELAVLDCNLGGV